MVVSGVLLLITVSSACLGVLVTRDANIQSAAYSLSISALKFNQPSIAPFILVRWACTSFHFWWGLLKAVVLYACSPNVMYSILWHNCTELHNPIRMTTHQASYAVKETKPAHLLRSFDVWLEHVLADQYIRCTWAQWKGANWNAWCVVFCVR